MVLSNDSKVHKVLVGRGGAEVMCSARDLEDETSWVRVSAVAFSSSRNILEKGVRANWLRSTQPSIHSRSINRVPASAGLTASWLTSKTVCVIPYCMRVTVVLKRLWTNAHECDSS